MEFGAKLDIGVVDGWTRLEFCSFDAYNEAVNLRKIQCALLHLLTYLLAIFLPKEKCTIVQ